MKRTLFGIVVVAFCFLPHGIASAGSVCATPVTYKIGAIDARFGVAAPAITDALSRAEAIWETPTGRNLFVYATTSAVLPIDFVYDSRQATSVQNAATLARLNLFKTALELIQTQFATFASSTKEAQATNSAQFAIYKADEARYNADVAATNTKGGASQDEYRELVVREAALATRFDTLKAEQDIQNTQVTKINALADSLVALSAILNAKIADYNQRIAKVGEFEQGLYTQYGSERRITIFEFTDTPQLVRVLAHEMGHSLGMDHIPTKGAIMYASNTGTSTLAAPADLAELSRVCGI